MIPGVPLLVLFAPLGVYVIFRRALGFSWSGITGTGGVALAVLFLVAAYGTDLAFFATSSISLFILSGAVIARRVGLAARPAWSAGGALLAIYWLLPPDIEFPPGEFKGAWRCSCSPGS